MLKTSELNRPHRFQIFLPRYFGQKWSTRAAKREVVFTKHLINIKNLPVAFENIKIAHITDLHFGPFSSPSFLDALLERILAEKPDWLFFTGDYVEPNASYALKLMPTLKNIQGICPAFAVLGNHEYLHKAVDQIIEIFAECEIKLLRNENLPIRKGGDCLWLVGVDNLYYLKHALRGIPELATCLLLSHFPDIIENLGINRVDFIAAGHTHGGQICLPGYGPPRVPSRYGRKYLAGFYEKNGVSMYVSRGIGTYGIPLRICCPPEIPFYILQRV